MRAFAGVLMMLGVAIIAGLIYVTHADRSDTVLVQSDSRTLEISRLCLWLLASAFAVLCCSYVYWLYRQIPGSWELVVIR